MIQAAWDWISVTVTGADSGGQRFLRQRPCHRGPRGADEEVDVVPDHRSVPWVVADLVDAWGDFKHELV